MHRGDGLLLALLMGACLLIAHPFVEMGFVDDWSYIKTTQVFIDSGRFVFNGWATTTLGWQILWGALFGRLLGFSFVHVRLSMLPVAFATVYLFHQILIRFGISRSNSIFGALALGFSPLFMLLSASYFTDVPGLFCTLFCLYLCQRVVGAATDRAAIAWLALAVVTNVVGGTVRQTAWFGVLFIVPSTIWLFRRQRRLLWTGTLFWLAGVVGVFLWMNWFNRQPYFCPSELFPAISAAVAGHAVFWGIKAFLCLLLLILPILCAWLPLARFVPRRRLVWLSLILIVLLTAFLNYCARHHQLNAAIAPWLTHILESMGMGSGDIPGKGTGPHYWQRITLSVFVLGSAVVFFLHLFSHLRLYAKMNQADRRCWHQMLWLLTPYAIGYAIAILIRGVADFTFFDRYLLPLQALGIIVLVRYYQDFAAHEHSVKHTKFSVGQLPVVSHVVLLAFAFYAIAGTHDWFALSRARLAAIQEVRRTGVPRTAIQGGFEYDAWTQLEAKGYVNDPRIVIPRDAFRPGPTLPTLPKECTTWVPNYLTPAVVPQYFVTYEPLSCFAPSPFPRLPIVPGCRRLLVKFS